MHLDEYQQLAARTLGRDRTHEQQLANAALGLTGESGEVAEVIKTHLFHATPLDQDALAKERNDTPSSNNSEFGFTRGADYYGRRDK